MHAWGRGRRRKKRRMRRRRGKMKRRDSADAGIFSHRPETEDSICCIFAYLHYKAAKISIFDIPLVKIKVYNFIYPRIH